MQEKQMWMQVSTTILHKWVNKQLKTAQIIDVKINFTHEKMQYVLHNKNAQHMNYITTRNKYTSYLSSTVNTTSNLYSAFSNHLVKQYVSVGSFNLYNYYISMFPVFHFKSTFNYVYLHHKYLNLFEYNRIWYHS